MARKAPARPAKSAKDSARFPIRVDRNIYPRSEYKSQFLKESAVPGGPATVRLFVNGKESGSGQIENVRFDFGDGVEQTPAEKLAQPITMDSASTPPIMLTRLLALRYLYLIAVVFTLINSILFLLAGVRQSLAGYAGIYRHVVIKEVANAKLPLLESLDMFLVALVFLIFSLGIMKIFIGYDEVDEHLPSWLRIRDFMQLKVLLWESVLVTLVVMCMSTIARNIDNLTWEVLVLPAIVLVLSVGLYLMRGLESSH